MPLNSTSVIKVVDLLCEGQIEGIVGGKKGIFLNETPVKSPNKKAANVPKKHFKFELKEGTRTQAQLKDYQKGGASNLTNISEEIGENYSETVNAKNKVTKKNYGKGKKIIQITDPLTTSVEFLFTIPSLFCTAMEGIARGQLFNAKVRIRISLKSKGTGFNEKFDETFEGISTSEYQFKTPIIDLTEDEKGELTAPFIIKIEKKVSKNGEDDYEVKDTDFEDIPKDTALEGTRGNRVFLTSMIERQDFKSRYPYTACVGLSLSTEAFSSLPTRAYLIKGLKVAIPHNATVRDDGSLEFNGAFDGSLLQDDDGDILKRWTTCPVCIFYDMLTSTKHAAGDFI